MRDYLRNSAEVEEGDRSLCDNVGNGEWGMGNWEWMQIPDRCYNLKLPKFLIHKSGGK